MGTRRRFSALIALRIVGRTFSILFKPRHPDHVKVGCNQRSLSDVPRLEGSHD